MYLTLDYYYSMGGSEGVDALRFPHMEAKARKTIDRITRGRVMNESPVRDAVKYAVFDLVRAMIADEAAGASPGREIASMSNDGVSVAFASSAASSVSARYASIAREWLAGETDACGVPLVYAGVDVG